MGLKPAFRLQFTLKNLNFPNSRLCKTLFCFRPVFYTSILAYLAWVSINSRLGGTSSPISILNTLSASAALSIVTCFSVRVSQDSWWFPTIALHSFHPNPYIVVYLRSHLYPCPSRAINAFTFHIIPGVFLLLSFFYQVQAAVGQYTHIPALPAPSYTGI